MSSSSLWPRRMERDCVPLCCTLANHWSPSTINSPFNCMSKIPPGGTAALHRKQSLTEAKSRLQAGKLFDLRDCFYFLWWTGRPNISLNPNSASASSFKRAVSTVDSALKHKQLSCCTFSTVCFQHCTVPHLNT